MSECYSCEDDRFEYVAENSDGRYIAKCTNCGLVQLFPRWTEKELAELYKNYSEYRSFVGQDKEKRIVRFPEITKYLGENKEQKILEIGCGKGWMLDYLQGLGYKNVSGIDLDRTVCDGERIRCLDISEVTERDYDFIFSLFQFEHCPVPLMFDNFVLNRLRDGGRRLYLVPNVEDPLMTVWKNENFKQFFFNDPHHCFYYSPQTIVKCVWDDLPEAEIGKLSVAPVQYYGLFNHLQWFLRGKPTNKNLSIPVIDRCYKMILERFGKTDRLVVCGQKSENW